VWNKSSKSKTGVVLGVRRSNMSKNAVEVADNDACRCDSAT